jgi:hypothetical protein
MVTYIFFLCDEFGRSKRYETEMKVLEIQNVKKAIGEYLENDWRVCDVMEWENTYHFVCELQMEVYDPYIFQQVTKSYKKNFELNRVEMGNGTYLLKQIHQDSFGGSGIGMPKEDVKDMKRLLYYMSKLIDNVI